MRSLHNITNSASSWTWSCRAHISSSKQLTNFILHMQEAFSATDEEIFSFSFFPSEANLLPSRERFAPIISNVRYLSVQMLLLVKQVMEVDLCITCPHQMQLAAYLPPIGRYQDGVIIRPGLISGWSGSSRSRTSSGHFEDFNVVFCAPLSLGLSHIPREYESGSSPRLESKSQQIWVKVKRLGQARLVWCMVWKWWCMHELI